MSKIEKNYDLKIEMKHKAFWGIDDAVAKLKWLWGLCEQEHKISSHSAIKRGINMWISWMPSFSVFCFHDVSDSRTIGLWAVYQNDEEEYKSSDEEDNID